MLKQLPYNTRCDLPFPLPVLGALANAENAFLDLCVPVGQQVFEGLLEQDREALCGPKGKHDPERREGRAGSPGGEITLGGRRLPVRRLRARGAEGELALPSFVFAAARDPLDRHTIEAIARGVSTRRYGRSLDRLPPEHQEREGDSRSSARAPPLYWTARPAPDRDRHEQVDLPE